MKLGAATILAVLMCAAPVRADHPLVTAGRRQFDAADFSGALRSLDAAERATDLSRDDVIELLETRAMVHLAMGNESALDQALLALASLDPRHTFSPAVRPEILARFDRVRSRVRAELAVRTHVAARARGVRIEAVVQNDPTPLVTAVRVSAAACDFFTTTPTCADGTSRSLCDPRGIAIIELCPDGCTCTTEPGVAACFRMTMVGPLVCE